MVVRCDGGAGRTIKQAKHNAERNCFVFFGPPLFCLPASVTDVPKVLQKARRAGLFDEGEIQNLRNQLLSARLMRKNTNRGPLGRAIALSSSACALDLYLPSP